MTLQAPRAPRTAYIADPLILKDLRTISTIIDDRMMTMMVLASRAPGRQAWTDSVTSHLRLFHKADNRQMNTTELKHLRVIAQVGV